MKKRLLSMILLLCMVLTMLPVTAHAENFTFYCQVCGNWVSAPGTYKYLDGTHCTLVTECPECGDVSEFGFWEHTGSGTATCTTGITCDLCGHEYGVLGHDWSFVSNGDDTHTRTCQREGCGATETMSCSGSEATCMAKAVCRECGAEYGEIDSNNHTGGTATCTEKAICQRCGEEYGETAPNNHTGGTATCTAKAICQRCGEEYGETDPDNHDYEVTVTKEPTCTEPSSANYVCKNCNVSSTETIPATGHHFDQLPWKEVSTAEGSRIEFECAVCHVKETCPLYVIEYKAGETYTETGWTNNAVLLLSDLVNWSDKYTVDNISENEATIKNSAGKLLMTLTLTQGEDDADDVWTFLVDEGVTAEDGDTVVVWSDSYEPGYGVKCRFLAKDYTITYDLDGGTAEGNPTGYNADTGTFTLKNPTRHGYTFTGWSGTGLTGENNLIVTIEKGSTGDRSYTAHWRRNRGSSGGSSYSYYTIKATAGKHGSISPDGSVSVREGKDQTFTIRPDSGYVVSDVKVDGKSIGAVRSYTFWNVKKSHTIAVSFAKADTFVDVPAGSYYEDAVQWALENGITTGTDSRHFSPDGICTRAQAVTFLWRAAGSPAPVTRTMPFTDVSRSSYYETAVLWAVENGITKGTSDTTFSPDQNCTRAQIVSFLWRSEKSPAARSSNPFADVSGNAYYFDAVLWAVQENITRGTSSTTFSSDSPCTRAQIVTFLWRCKA